MFCLWFIPVTLAEGFFTLLPHKLLSFDRLDFQVLLESVDLGLSEESAQGVWEVMEER